MYMLGIDLGTSYIKGGILELDEYRISHVTRQPFPTPLQGLPPHYHEVDPTAVIQATRALIEELVNHAPANARNCAGILVSSQMHGFLLTDRRGKPLTPLITWLDQRALTATGQVDKTGQTENPTYFEALENQLSQEEIIRLGNGFKAGLPLCALYTLARQNQLPQDDPVLWSLSDYVMARLAHAESREAGVEAPIDAAQVSCMEPTIAASLGAYDFSTGTWHTDVLHKLGLDRLIRPRLVTATEAVYTLSLDGQDVPVYPTLGDHQCATLGSLLQPGELALNISTGSQVSLLTEDWSPSPNYESRPYFGGRSLNTVTRVPAGRSLSGLVQLLTEIPRRQGVELADPWPTIVEAVQAATGSTSSATTPSKDAAELTVNLSFFGGAFGATGSITHMTEANMTVGHLFRAAFIHMAQNYAQCAQWLGWPAGSPTSADQITADRNTANRNAADGNEEKRIVFAGGLAQRFDALRDAVSTQLQSPYRMSPHPEDTLLGLLALGLLITHRAPDLDAAVAQLSATSFS